MNDPFDLTTLLILVVAVVIFLRLRSVLGRRDPNEPPRRVPYGTGPVTPPERDNVVPMPRTMPRMPTADTMGVNVDKRLAGIEPDNKAREPLKDIAMADNSFDVQAFIKGAKAAYEMIVTAYAKGDRETLRNLLSREVYDSFSAVLAEREGRGETTEFSFVGFVSAEIVDAHLTGRLAHVTVRFVTDLVTAVRDRTGFVVEGEVNTVRQVTDVWTFMRDLSSPDPNWRLVATDSP